MKDAALNLTINMNATGAFAFAKFMAVTDGWSEACTNWVDSGMEWADMLHAFVGAGFQLEMNVDGDVAVFTVDAKQGRAAIKVDDWGGDFGLFAAGSTREAAAAVLAAAQALIPERVYATDDTVAVSFWSYDPHSGGGQRFVRDLPRLRWADVQTNYPMAVRDRLDTIVSLRDAPAMGRLFVFHGPPGTGKSRLLQTMAAEWHEWVDVHYIVDSEMFFGSASYMTQVMLGNRHDSDRWRLVVAEDSDEFIDAHSKAKTGQGSARLLNICDGLVGQGLKVMVLASTNVHAARFNKAVVRPGRCAALVEFPAFPPDEAAAWCEWEGVEHDGFTVPATLADLYAIKSGVTV